MKDATCSHRLLRRRTARPMASLRIAALLAVAWAAACTDESVVDPRVVASDAASQAMAVAQAGDRDILVALYHATDGPNWRDNTNWLSDAPLGEWKGVMVDGTGRVVDLTLVYNGLSGSIPAELGGLAKLEAINLGINELSGPIPAELGGLANLESFDLGLNELSGPIPAELSSLTKLEKLRLWGNRLSGTISPELGKLARLNHLWIRDNQLSGTIPLSFRQLLRLEDFAFGDNSRLCLPDGLVAWYERIRERNGPVCPDREVLRAVYEAAGGGGWTNADGWLGDGPLDAWYGVDVDSSGLVSTMDLAGNGLSSSLSRDLGKLAGLTALRVGDNALSGRLPTSLAQTPLRELRYANTAMCAPVEPWLQEWLRSLARHEGTGMQCPPLSDREILTALYEQTDGPNWRESRNWLTDAPLGDWYGVETDGQGRVVELWLGANGLDGPIPAELGGLARLEDLGLDFNRLSGSIPPALGDLTSLKLLALHRNELIGPIPPTLGGLTAAEWIALSINSLSGAIPPELGGLAGLQELHLNNNHFTSVPPELGDLVGLKELALEFNRLTAVPEDLGRLDSLAVLWLLGNELTSVPAELGELNNLQVLRLGANQLTSVPPEFGRLANLVSLDLGQNRLTSVPGELGRLANLEALWLQSNNLTSIPAELGGLSKLYLLDLAGNRLTDVPRGLAGGAGTQGLALSADDHPAAHLTLTESRDYYWGRSWERPEGVRSMSVSTKPVSSDILSSRRKTDRDSSAAARSRVGRFASLAILDLSSNALVGPLPAGLLEFTGLTSLGLKDNTALSGPLPLDMTALSHLDDLHTTGTELCAPPDPEFLDWLDGIARQRVAHCAATEVTAYLTQAVQSREFPVPLVAGEPALLRVFLTSERAGGRMPPVRATFHRDGAVVHRVDIPGTPHPIPREIDESSMTKSANAEIPGHLVQPGLEVVIEPDPDGTLDPDLGVPRRIPPEGRLAVDIRAMPVFEVTLVPFIWQENPDYSIADTVAAMAADPDGHALFERTHLLLPISEIEATAHAPVLTSTNNGFGLLSQVEMIRVAEGGRGHYLAVMSPPTTPGWLGGVAYGIGSWSSFSVLSSEIIAHEFGHNRALYHAPCGGAGGPDRYYPYERGNIGAWGYDFATGELVPPSRNDYMSYCDLTWTSDYQFTNAVRYRVETESNSIIVTAGTGAGNASGPALLLWGGLDGDGAPRLMPSFFMDAPPALPETGGPWRLTGEDPSGAALFSLSFAMAEFTDTDDDRAGFSFVVPTAWTGKLARITLEGPGGSARLDHDTDLPTTILRDAATGRIRGILEGTPAQADLDSMAGADAEDLLILFSRGIPNR